MGKSESLGTTALRPREVRAAGARASHSTATISGTTMILEKNLYIPWDSQFHIPREDTRALLLPSTCSPIQEAGRALPHVHYDSRKDKLKVFPRCPVTVTNTSAA